MELGLDEKDYLACCGSTKFAKAMATTGPFYSYEEAVNAARRIWFNEVSISLLFSLSLTHTHRHTHKLTIFPSLKLSWSDL